MPDPLSAATTLELPHEPLLGLHRRHQAGLFPRSNDGDGEGHIPPGGGGTDNSDTENRDGNEPQINGTDFPSQQASGTPTNNTGNIGGAGGDNQNPTTVGQPSPTTNLFSPLSGSIGIGVFRISRLYCFLSIISALMAIALAPIPTHKIEYRDLASMMYEVNNPTKLTMTEAKNDDSGSIFNNMNSIVAELKSWSIEEFVAHAAFRGVAASRNRGIESSKVDDRSDEKDINKKKETGNEQRKRRRRPAVPVEQRHDDSNEKSCGVANEMETSSVKKSLFPSTSAKADTNENKNGNHDVSQDPASRLRNWVERMNMLVEETLIEIIQRRKKKLKMAAKQKVRWASLLKYDDENTDKAKRGEENSGDNYGGRERNDGSKSIENKRRVLDEEWQWIDHIFLEYSSFPYIATNIIDKILKSTIRLCIITNFLLTMTYLLHSAVAAWFLSHSGSSEVSNNATTTRRQHETSIREDPARMISEWSFTSSSGATGARERMGGFLIFKLLLISAVLAPDTLDLMILVTWFTLLGCLRSLDHLAHSTNINLAAIGRPPKVGIVQLLFWVLACDIVAAGSCMALFHTAGCGMVLLLTCDCALLGTDTVSHILKYYQSVFENSHDGNIRDLEERQLNLHRANEDENAYDSIEEEEEREEIYAFIGLSGNQEQPLAATTTMTPIELQQESGRLDHQMEGLELAHSRRLSILDTAIFCLDMTCHILTVAHFCHIWILHGVQFTLIDGVLALHLHSAISTACAKLARRRNVRKITRDLEGYFFDATDDELKQASVDGDVCCICLGSMTKGGNVKKVHCGHIYHTHCLREVIERAQNLQSAKCPLCRAPLLDGCHSVADPSRRNEIYNSNNFSRESNTPIGPNTPAVQAENHTIDTETEGNDGGDVVADRQEENERALFRFSTEGILPVWLPVPAFSFEVVRRPPLGAQRVAQPQNQQRQTAPPISTPRLNSVAALSLNQGEDNPELQTEFEIQAPQLQQQDEQLPFFQRFLLFAGLIPMSPAEEARALMQLVDMFPQYDRSDLSRELRNRGSLEAVTEAILNGIIPGVPRGE